MTAPPDDYLARRVMPDGTFGGVIPLTYGRARLVVGSHADAGYDDGW